MSTKIDAVTGLVTISIAGITAALTPEDARQWGDVLMSYAPLVLIGILLLRIRSLDQKLKEYETKLEKANEKLLLAYSTILNKHGKQNLPSMQDFATGHFDIKQCGVDCNDSSHA